MKINKEIRQLSRQLLRASIVDGQLDRGKISSVVRLLTEKKPRHYVDILENYKRLIRLEVEKRHARVESATPLNTETNSRIVKSLKKKYGEDLTTEFVVNPELLGGMRIRVGSDVWDGSVRNRLERLQQQL
jgi:F-type H+-transporting ATPase subunit delta